MSWLPSIAAALLSGVLGGAGAGAIALLCVGWYRIPSREGASGYFVVFVGLIGAVAGVVLGLIFARLGQAWWGPGVLREGTAAAAGVLLVLVAALGACRWMADVPPTSRGEPLDLIVEVRLPEGLTEFPARDAAEAFLSLAAVEGRPRVQKKEAAGALEVGRARLEDGRWLVPGRAPVFSSRGELVMTVKIGAGEAERFLLPASAGRRPAEGWSEWMPRARSDGGAPMNTMTFRYRVRRAGG